MRTTRLAATIAIVMAAGGAPCGSAVAAECGALAGMRVADGRVIAATPVNPPFTIVSPYRSEPAEVAVPFCRVQGVLRPSEDSDIRFEVWLPPPGAWNGRYEGVGNGGFAGSLIYTGMANALAGGYAVSATDTGHGADGTDARWAIGHPEKVIDFGERSIHVTAIAAKAVIAAYYGRAAERAYFSGCSDGGREALVEAERYPDDYDGIVAGAPANAWVKLVTTAMWNETALAAEPGSAIPPDKLAVISHAVHAACHATGGVVGAPEQCRFDPATLACPPGGEGGACLSRPQIAALDKIYGGPRDAAGHPVFPGFAPGGEEGPAGWALWITGRPGQAPLQLQFGTGFYSGMVYEDPTWTLKRFDLGPDLAAAAAKLGAVLDATDPDLSRFRAHGGKLITYHGWYDAAIPPQNSVDFLAAVQAKNGGAAATDGFYRLFMMPGMGHCRGGPGEDAIGGVFGPSAPVRDATHDVVEALARWVEQGVAPEKLVASAYAHGQPSQGVASERVLTPYGR